MSSTQKTHIPQIQPLRVGRHVTNPAQLEELRDQLGLAPVGSRMHLTLAFSRAPVDWNSSPFFARTGLIELTATRLPLARFGNLVVVLIESERLRARGQEMINAGASWDFEPFTPHVTLGKAPQEVEIPEHFVPREPIWFGPEYRKLPKL